MKDDLTNFFCKHLQVWYTTVFKQLDAIDTIKAIVFDHVERIVHSEALKHSALPLGHVTLFSPGVLDPATQQVVCVWAQGRGWALTQLSTATLSVGIKEC